MLGHLCGFFLHLDGIQLVKDLIKVWHVLLHVLDRFLVVVPCSLEVALLEHN